MLLVRSLGGNFLLPLEWAAEGGVSSEVIQVRASGERMLEEHTGSGYEILRVRHWFPEVGRRASMGGGAELGTWVFLQ